MNWSQKIAYNLYKRVLGGEPLKEALIILDATLEKYTITDLKGQILRNLRNMLQENIAKESAYIASPFPLTEQDLHTILKVGNIDTKTNKVITQDRALLAGFTLTYKGKIYDGSARKYITELAHK